MKMNNILLKCKEFFEDKIKEGELARPAGFELTTF